MANDGVVAADGTVFTWVSRANAAVHDLGRDALRWSADKINRRVYLAIAPQPS